SGTPERSSAPERAPTPAGHPAHADGASVPPHGEPRAAMRTPHMLALVLPYVELPDIHLFGLTIHPFGVFAAIGVYTGAVLTVRAGRVYGPGDTKSLSEVFTWALVGGLLGAHLLHVLGYHPELLHTQGPLVLLKIWDGVSSMGGVLGGIAGIVIYFWRKGLRIYPYWAALALGSAPARAVTPMSFALVHHLPSPP